MPRSSSGWRLEVMHEHLLQVLAVRRFGIAGQQRPPI
jgi:hypothetical protein